MNIQQATESINRLHQSIIQSARRSVQDAIKIGEIISEQKKLLSHGEFLPWVATLPFAERTARNYISLFEHKDKTANVADLSEAYKKIQELEFREKQTDQQAKNHLIEEYKRTGVKPDGWDRSTDYEYQKRLKEEQEYRERSDRHFKQQQEIKQQRQNQENDSNIFIQAVNEAVNNLEKENEIRKQWKDKIRMSEENGFNDAILDYLQDLDDDNRRIQACYDIIKICKNIANQLQRENLGV